MFTSLSNTQIEAIKVEANKQIRKKYRMLGTDTVDRFHIIYILRAYQKIIKEKK
ncbi:MAG: hypothetical protein MUP81_02310 [Dehalococcoidia bacterium]|nr:hypothetical protein [Dehalococcoidia bacterium]